MKPRSKHWLLPVIIFGVAVLMAGFGVLLFLGALAISAGGGSFKGSIALVHVTGMIVGGGDGEELLGGSIAGSERIIDQLEEARKDKNVKAVVLRINSPGGSAAASQEIYQEILKVTQRKIVVVSMGDMAASGGYYIASAADKIVANPATMTGSIGVIMELNNMEALFKKIGLAPEIIKSGPHKDIGSPSRKLTSEERRILQRLIGQVYNQFLDDVARGRKRLTRRQIKTLADGRVYTGAEAKRLGLVDELGGLKAAIRLAAAEAHIKGEPNIVTYESPSLLHLFMGAMANRFTESVSQAISQAFRSALREAQSLPVAR